jgi:DNA-binding transcriptional MerR regulator
MDKLFNISEVSNLLFLIDKKKKKPKNYIIRYWEKEFKNIKPKIINKRRYYSKKQIEILKLIKYLLKDKGLTIKGVKSVLKSNINSLDGYDSYSLKAQYHKISIKNKTKSILEKLKNFKKNGKKISFKS